MLEICSEKGVGPYQIAIGKGNEFSLRVAVDTPSPIGNTSQIIRHLPNKHLTFLAIGECKGAFALGTHLGGILDD